MKLINFLSLVTITALFSFSTSVSFAEPESKSSGKVFEPAVVHVWFEVDGVNPEPSDIQKSIDMVHVEGIFRIINGAGNIPEAHIQTPGVLKASKSFLINKKKGETLEELDSKYGFCNRLAGDLPCEVLLFNWNRNGGQAVHKIILANGIDPNTPDTQVWLFSILGRLFRFEIVHIHNHLVAGSTL